MNRRSYSDLLKQDNQEQDERHRILHLILISPSETVYAAGSLSSGLGPIGVYDAETDKVVMSLHLG